MNIMSLASAVTADVARLVDQGVCADGQQTSIARQARSDSSSALCGWKAIIPKITVFIEDSSLMV